MSGFSTQQRRLLEAMGYELLHRAVAPAGVAAATVQSAATTEKDRPSRPLAAATPSVGPAIATESPLWSHVLRALGGPPERAGLFLLDAGPALQFDGPRLGLNLAALREDPDAKRRLWRTLRELRPD